MRTGLCCNEEFEKALAEIDTGHPTAESLYCKMLVRGDLRWNNAGRPAASRKWPEVSDFVARCTFLHIARIRNHTDMRELYAFHTDMRELYAFSHGPVF